MKKLLAHYSMKDCNPILMSIDTSVKLLTIMDSEAYIDQKEYISIVGGIIFAAVVTKPDIIYTISTLSKFLNNPSTKYLATAKWALCYFQDTLTLGIMYGLPPTYFSGFSDVDWTGDINTR